MTGIVPSRMAECIATFDRGENRFCRTTPKIPRKFAGLHFEIDFIKLSGNKLSSIRTIPVSQASMKEPKDPAIAAALEYEFATHDAIANLRDRRSPAKVKACLRWADALLQLEALPDSDHRRAGDFLAMRGKIPIEARRIITDAMVRLDAAAMAAECRFAKTQTKH